MAQPADPQLHHQDIRRLAIQRLFLRAVLLSEHLVFLAAASYALWTEEKWKALVFGRVGATLLLGIVVSTSFLVALVLAAVMLWCRSPLWVATLAGGVLGPLLGALVILVIVSVL